MESILNEAGAFASEVLGPLNREGDLVGARLAAGRERVLAGLRPLERRLAGAALQLRHRRALGREHEGARD